MRLRNISSGPVYESLTSSEILTGKTTNEINILKETLHKILHDTRFEPILSDDELKQLSVLKEKSEFAKNRNVEELPGYGDPYGLKALERARHEHAVAIQKARMELAKRDTDKRSRFKDIDLTDKVEDLVPKKLDGVPTSLKDIASHNAAIRSKNG